jgi:hypothetical protein
MHVAETVTKMALKQPSLEISRLVYTLNCKPDGSAYCLDAHYLAKEKGNTP